MAGFPSPGTSRGGLLSGTSGSTCSMPPRTTGADLARSLLHTALRRGGVFHLWGHSWEVEATGQWGRLEEVLQFLGEFVDRAAAVTNGQVCRASQPVRAEQVAP